MQILVLTSFFDEYIKSRCDKTGNFLQNNDQPAVDNCRISEQSRSLVDSFVEGIGNIVDWDIDDEILMNNVTSLPQESTPISD